MYKPKFMETEAYTPYKKPIHVENHTKDNYMDKKILHTIKYAMRGEKYGHHHYKHLMDLTNDSKVRSILKTMSLQEKKHYFILKEIYKELTDEDIEINLTYEKDDVSLLDSIDSLIVDNLDEFEFYRKLYFCILNIKIRDMLYEVMSDKQNYSIKLIHIKKMIF